MKPKTFWRRMNSWQRIIIAIFSILVIVLTISIISTLSKEEVYCKLSDGKWTSFGNICDSNQCNLKYNPSENFCKSGPVYTCYCGQDRCWNGETCVDRFEEIKLDKDYSFPFNVILDLDKKNIVNVGGNIHINDLIRYNRRDQISIQIGNYFHKIIEYRDLETPVNSLYNLTFIAPKVPGNYRVSLLQYLNNQPVHKDFKLIVLGDVKTKEEAFEVAKVDITWKIGKYEIKNITTKEIELVDNKWHVNLIVDYSFGCCSACPPEVNCIAMCVPCSFRTVDVKYIIDKMGMIEEEQIEEINCIGNEKSWWKNTNGQRLCSEKVPKF